MKLFISYAHKDEQYVTKLAGSLKTQGIDVFFDKSEIPWGDEWPAALSKNLSQSDVVVSVLSPRLNPQAFNPNVFFELGMAVAMGKPVIYIIPGAVLKSGRF